MPYSSLAEMQIETFFFSQIPGWLVWLKYLSWFYYANELLCVNQWQFVDHFEGKI